MVDLLSFIQAIPEGAHSQDGPGDVERVTGFQNDGTVKMMLLKTGIDTGEVHAAITDIVITALHRAGLRIFRGDTPIIICGIYISGIREDDAGNPVGESVDQSTAVCFGDLNLGGVWYEVYVIPIRKLHKILDVAASEQSPEIILYTGADSGVGTHAADLIYAVGSFSEKLLQLPVICSCGLNQRADGRSRRNDQKGSAQSLQSFTNIFCIVVEQLKKLVHRSAVFKHGIHHALAGDHHGRNG